jgi:hypothetical protein
MDIVEFGDTRVARLQHLDVRLRCDGSERVGIDAIEERVHRRAPRPERIAVGAALSGATRDRALERMRVQVRHPRHQRTAGALGASAATARSAPRRSTTSESTSIRTSRRQPSGVSAYAAKRLIDIRCERRAQRRRVERRIASGRPVARLARDDERVPGLEPDRRSAVDRALRARRRAAKD